MCWNVRHNPNELNPHTRGREHMARHYSMKDFFRQIPNVVRAV